MTTPLSVAKEEEAMRIDRWLRHHFPNAPFSLLQKWLRSGQIRAGSKRIRADFRLEAGMNIRVPPMAVNYQNNDTEPGQLSESQNKLLKDLVIYQDNFFLALNKPAGFATQGGSGIKTHIDGLLGSLQYASAEKPRLVHRLDREVSGVLLLARSRKAAMEIGKAFRYRKIAKTYCALLEGVPANMSGLVSSPLVRNPDGLVHTADADPAITNPTRKSLSAETHYQIIDQSPAGGENNGLSLALLTPVTGRKHQLRVHMQSLDMPVCGDRKYGRKISKSSKPSPHLFLHALELVLPPLMGRKTEIRITAPPPAAFMKKCRNENLQFDRTFRGK